MRITNKELNECVSRVDNNFSSEKNRGTLSYFYDYEGNLIDNRDNAVLVITITSDEKIKSEIKVDRDGNEPFTMDKYYQDRVRRTQSRIGTSPFRWSETSYSAGWSYLQFLKTGNINFYKGVQNAF